MWTGRPKETRGAFSQLYEESAVKGRRVGERRKGQQYKKFQFLSVMEIAKFNKLYNAVHA